MPNLRNGRRLPIVMALSCTLGRFAAAPEKSLAEKLLFRDGGGAIATLAATELTFISTNRVLNFNTFEELTPREPGVAKPIGLAIMAAKFASLDATVVIGPDGNPRGNETVEENNQKYNLLGDPAQRLLSPRQEIRFDAATADSLVAGKRARVKGAVYANGEIDRSFSGTVMLQAREPDDPSGYRREDGFTIGYRYPGGTMYQGFTEVSGGEFEFTFRVPRSAQTGPLGYFLAYADNSAIDAVARKDDVVLRFPTAGDSTALRPVDGAPRVRMGFQGGARKIKPGAILEAKVSDGDGVNILSTTPEGKLSLVFDRSNLPIDVTEFFEFDFGGADTSGVLRFPLPDIPVGRHEAALKVSDTFGQTRLDTLTFTLTDPLDYSAQVVLNYPNPFATSTQFLFRLTGRARIRLDLFTLSGKRIRRIEQVADPGEAWVFWDGRDSVGDAIANGTYLYVARVEFMDVDRPETKLRGKVVKIE